MLNLSANRQIDALALDNLSYVEGHCMLAENDVLFFYQSIFSVDISDEAEDVQLEEFLIC